MKNGFIKIGAVTPEIKVADTEFNKSNIIASIKNAAENGVKIVVLPELCVTGATCGDLFYQSALLDGAWKAVEDIAAETAQLDIVSVIGAPVRENGKLYDCAVVISNGVILGIVPKTNNSRTARWFASGENNTVFTCKEMPDLCFGVEIGDDLALPVPPSTDLALSGASVILNLSADYEASGKNDYRRMLVTAQSARLDCAYVVSGAGEGESTTDFVFGGHSIIAENGRLLDETEIFNNKLIFTDIDLGRLLTERRKNGGFCACACAATVEFSLCVTDTRLTRVFPKSPFIPEDKTLRDKRCKEILTMQAAALKKRLVCAYAKTAVIGISGGLDSCLALIVAAKAMDMLGRPRTDIVAITMPCFGTTSRTRTNAEILCELLGVRFSAIDIAKSVRSHFEDIGHDENNHDVVFENSQARERTQILMDTANKENGLVVGTGDLSELALGWATYNGDHMSMYGVNASVPKTLVRELVRYYAVTCENEELSKVLTDIVETPVSPELLPSDNDNISQKTEDLVGPYELHDFFLYHIVRFACPPKKLYRMAVHTFGGEYDNETILKWLKTFIRRFFNQQFKRSCLPDGVKVGSVSLSPRGDWCMPSDAVSALWLKELEEIG